MLYDLWDKMDDDDLCVLIVEIVEDEVECVVVVFWLLLYIVQIEVGGLKVYFVQVDFGVLLIKIGDLYLFMVEEIGYFLMFLVDDIQII